MSNHKDSERTELRRKPRFHRLEIQRKRRESEHKLRELDKLDFYRRPTFIAH